MTTIKVKQNYNNFRERSTMRDLCTNIIHNPKVALGILSLILAVSFIYNIKIPTKTEKYYIPKHQDYDKVSEVLDIEVGGGLLLKTSAPVFPVAGVASKLDSPVMLVDKLTAPEILVEGTTQSITIDSFAFANKGYIRPTILNIRKAPSVESEIIGTYLFNQEVRYSDYNDNWAVVNANDTLGFIHKSFINSDRHSYVSKEVSSDKRKSYMDYTKITHKNTPQYKLQTKAKTYNGIRTVNGRYCIALGPYYSNNVGQYVDVVLDNGVVIECIVGDCKADRDTINGQQGKDGGVVEFIVSTGELSSQARSSGDCSFNSSKWNSSVKEIRLYNVDLM